MTENNIPHPPIASADEWRSARVKLLAREKALTKERDQINAQRRRLPMVKVEKTYTFDTPDGKKTLLDLFDGRRQLIVYHFMFGPDWTKGCMGCTGYIDALGDLSTLAERDTGLVLVSRTPLEKLEAYKAERGWDLPWISSYGTDFNYDFHVTLDENIAPIEYNYKSKEQLIADRGGDSDLAGELPGTSIFFRIGDDVYHTYSVYARGGEGVTDAISLLDLTPYGRQEDFEDSPAGWPQKPTYG
ncbi:MAG: DUF899 domain-containing protein [Armatimonas sp.]